MIQLFLITFVLLALAFAGTAIKDNIFWLPIWIFVLNLYSNFTISSIPIATSRFLSLAFSWEKETTEKIRKIKNKRN